MRHGCTVVNYCCKGGCGGGILAIDDWSELQRWLIDSPLDAACGFADTTGDNLVDHIDLANFALRWP